MMDLFDFCQHGFDLSSVGLCLAATVGEPCLSSSEPHGFIMVDINRNGKLAG